MDHWSELMQSVIDDLEARLDQDIALEDVAARMYVSPFHFQRMFHAICGVTLGEYIRFRRLTLAGQELSQGTLRVIDAALKYGYDSPDSFARAFQRFHGCLPSQARERGVKLHAFSPLRIEPMTLEGGNMLEFKIVDKASFTVMGLGRRFDNETSYQEIPMFWEEYMAQEDRPVCGVFGVCLDEDGRWFRYLIADVYEPWKDIPHGCETVTFPAHTWAVFPCTMQNLQDVNTRMWKEWLPACRDYRLAGNYNLELYAPPEMNYAELWLPVEKI